MYFSRLFLGIKGSNVAVMISKQIVDLPVVRHSVSVRWSLWDREEQQQKKQTAISGQVKAVNLHSTHHRFFTQHMLHRKDISGKALTHRPAQLGHHLLNPNGFGSMDPGCKERTRKLKTSLRNMIETAGRECLNCKSDVSLFQQGFLQEIQLK